MDLFTLSKLLGPLTEPSTQLLLLWMGASVAVALGRKRWGMWLGGAAFGATLIAALTPAPVWAVRALEERFPRPEVLAPGSVDGIIILGGALDTETTVARGDTALNAAAERLVIGAALARSNPRAEVIFTGGSASLWAPESREADYAGALLLSMGVEEGQLRTDRDARNTYENALNSFALAAPDPAERWILVTSAAHMPRAIGLFRGVGWPREALIAYPTDYRTSPRMAWEIVGFLGGLSGLDLAAHEVVGALVDRIVGRSQELFPSP